MKLIKENYFHYYYMNWKKKDTKKTRDYIGRWAEIYVTGFADGVWNGEYYTFYISNKKKMHVKPIYELNDEFYDVIDYEIWEERI